MNNINEMLVKISGRSAITNQLELGQEVKVLISGQVVKQETLDNQDGTVDVVYVVKPFLPTEIK